MVVLFIAGCVRGEPLVFPDDPSAAGVPVGVRTVTTADQTFEVWYPASDGVGGVPDVLNFDAFVPAVFTDAVGPVTLPTATTTAHRDAAVRPATNPYPVILFSHGLGGFRTQSWTWAEHLASRGYVVVAPDHPGRMLADVLPCLFAPPLGGTCSLSQSFAEDPAQEDLATARDWITAAATADPATADGWLSGAIDAANIGLGGHSEGGTSVTTLANGDDTFRAIYVMAGGVALTSDIPGAVVGGSCDAYFPQEQLATVAGSRPLIEIAGAGHLAFSDICPLNLVDLATPVESRDDRNQLWLDFYVSLARSGCPGETPTMDGCDAYLPLDPSAAIRDAYATETFDAALYGTGDGPTAGQFPEATLE